jgi:hypothetical protein
LQAWNNKIKYTNGLLGLTALQHVPNLVNFKNRTTFREINLLKVLFWKKKSLDYSSVQSNVASLSPHLKCMHSSQLTPFSLLLTLHQPTFMKVQPILSPRTSQLNSISPHFILPRTHLNFFLSYFLLAPVSFFSIVLTFYLPPEFKNAAMIVPHPYRGHTLEAAS